MQASACRWLPGRQHVLDEAERSLHDALCVLSQTVADARVVYGGGFPEMRMAKVRASFEAWLNEEPHMCGALAAPAERCRDCLHAVSVAHVTMRRYAHAALADADMANKGGKCLWFSGARGASVGTS